MKVTISRHTLNTEQVVVELDPTVDDPKLAFQLVDERALEQNVRMLVAEFMARKAKLTPEVEQILWGVIRVQTGTDPADPMYLPADTRASIDRARQEIAEGAVAMNGVHG